MKNLSKEIGLAILTVIFTSIISLGLFLVDVRAKTVEYDLEIARISEEQSKLADVIFSLEKSSLTKMDFEHFQLQADEKHALEVKYLELKITEITNRIDRDEK